MGAQPRSARIASIESQVPRNSDRAWWTSIVYIATVAMFLRFFDLPLKPLHHDEGVNALLLTALVRSPHSYQYDPANYHGPTLYYFAWLSVAALGLTTVAIRAVTAFAGLLTVLVLLALKRQIGPIGALAAGVLLALSPGAVYFSRYFIHEMLLVLFTVTTVVASVMWWQRNRAVYLHAAAASAGLMFATKETAIVSAVVLIGAMVGTTVICALRGASSGVSDWGREVVMRLRQPRGLPFYVQGAGIFIAVNVLFYSSFFTHWQGVPDAVRTFTIWTKTGTSAHTRPWHTYLAWLSAEELPLLLLGVAGALWALWKSDNRFAVFAALWTLGMLGAYSVIPYKTPWLTLNIIVPLAISGGYAFDLLWHTRRFPPRAVPLLIAVAVVGVGAYQTIVLNFAQYDNGRYPYVYAHTSRELLALVREIGRVQSLNPGVSIAITSPDHFPLSWYLREYRAGYYGRPVVTNDPLVVASEEQLPTLERAFGERYERVGSYRLRPGVQLVLFVRRDLKKV